MTGHFKRDVFEKFLIINNVVEFKDKKVKLSSGRYSNLYLNIKSLMNDVTIFDKFEDYVEIFVNDKGLCPDYFIGVPEGMTKLGLIMTYTQAKQETKSLVRPGHGYHPLPIARGKVKKHGSLKDKYFLGNVKGRAVVLEDVLTTGNSVISLVESLIKNEAEVSAVVGVVDRLELRRDGLNISEKLSKLGVKYYPMTSVKTLLPLAYEKLRPPESLVKKINEYYKKYGCEEFEIIL